LRAKDNQTNVSILRGAFNKMNLGDVNIKKFGEENDFLIKLKKKIQVKI